MRCLSNRSTLGMCLSDWSLGGRPSSSMSFLRVSLRRFELSLDRLASVADRNRSWAMISLVLAFCVRAFISCFRCRACCWEFFATRRRCLLRQDDRFVSALWRIALKSALMAVLSGSIVINCFLSLRPLGQRLRFSQAVRKRC